MMFLKCYWYFNATSMWILMRCCFRKEKCPGIDESDGKKKAEDMDFPLPF